VKWREEEPRNRPAAHSHFGLPVRLWNRLVQAAGVGQGETWADLSKKKMARLVGELDHGSYWIDGKSTFKDEFVSCGGVDLAEVDFRTMESKTIPGLFLAGEVLDIDGLTGGFNFQSAWTTGWLAGEAMARP
jgi:predicted Rossmann fold flavoprotein